SYRDWDATGGYLLALAMPLKKLLLTGKQPNIAPQINAATANALLNDGRGWSNNDRYSFYDKLGPDTLLAKLGSWSPTVRERASIAISRRQGDKPIAALVDLLDSPNLFARYGACEVFILLKAAAAPAVPKLTALLNHKDLWMRIKAAEALSNIGPPAMPSLPKLLERLAQDPAKSDPRGMEQRYLCFAIFGTLLKNSLDGVDRDQLRKAVAAGLRNEDGRARSDIASVYKMLSYKEIEPLLPAILDATAKPAPSGEMFADGIRIAGLEVLAAHHIAEGIPACTNYILNQNIWASQIRTPEILKILVSYGAHAKSAIPQLKQAAEIFDKGEGDFPKDMSVQKAADVRKAIADIEASTDKPDVRRIR
ncbi:MAG: HEAT repeat domain-containing protein, partial [Verrucomicrobiota bacterium]